MIASKQQDDSKSWGKGSGRGISRPGRNQNRRPESAFLGYAAAQSVRRRMLQSGQMIHSSGQHLHPDSVGEMRSG